MATILTKKKDTTGAPSAGDLTNSTGGAELAVNTADKRLYTKDSGGNVVEVGINPTSITTGTLNTSGAVVLNDAGDNVDFRVEGDTEANLLFVDASTDRVGIGTNTPSGLFDVANRGITKGSLPAGSVLQVVQTVYSTDVTVASTSFQDTNLSASITPTAASSKILVFVTQSYLIYRESNQGISGGMKLLRGATGIVEHDFTPQISAGVNASSSVATRAVWSFCYLDSPNTTSSTTYKTQGKVSTTSDSGQIRFQQNSTEESSITLMEIAA